MPVVVEPYNPDWATQFLQIKQELETFLSGVEYQSIEHVGSTSIPGLPAKPILDIDVVATASQLDAVIAALSAEGTGLLYMGELYITHRHAFRAPGLEPVRNLYVCVEGSAALRNHLGVRKLLVENEGLREEYGRLKMELGSRGMEIHEYMNLKGKFVFHLLELSGALTTEEINEIKTATGSAKRTYPVKTENLVLREFIITDVQGLVASKLCQSTKDAQKLAIEIIQDAGNSVRTRMELIVLCEEKGETKTVGRVGVRKIGKNVKTADGGLMARIKKTLDTLGEGEEITVLYIFLDPELEDRGFAKEALDAFIPVSAKIMGHKLTTASDVQENKSLKSLDEEAIRGSEVYQVLDTLE